MAQTGNKPALFDAGNIDRIVATLIKRIEALTNVTLGRPDKPLDRMVEASLLKLINHDFFAGKNVFRHGDLSGNATVENIAIAIGMHGGRAQ